MKTMVCSLFVTVPRMNVTKQSEFPGDVCDSFARPFAYGAQNLILSSTLLNTSGVFL